MILTKNDGLRLSEILCDIEEKKIPIYVGIYEVEELIKDY